MPKFLQRMLEQRGTGLALAASIVWLAPQSALSTISARPVAAVKATAPVFTSLDMINARTGFATGLYRDRYGFWATDDGGIHWHRRQIANLPEPSSLAASPVLYFEKVNQGWIAWIHGRSVGRSGSAGFHSIKTLTILHTQDGGRHWSVHRQHVLAAMSEVEQIDFVGHNGWIRVFSGGVMNQGDTGIYHTTNNGHSWILASAAAGYVPNPVSTPDAVPTVDAPMPMTFTNANDGWVAVSSPIAETYATLYHSTSAGRRWSRVPLPLPPDIQHKAYATTEFQPAFAGSQASVLVQFQGGSHGKVVDYRTQDGGKQWTFGPSFELNASAYRLAVSAISPTRAFVIGVNGGSFGVTKNGGDSWSNLPIAGHLKAVFDGGYQIVSFNMISTTRGWLLLDPGNQKSFALLRTKDGGRTWGIQRW